MVERATVSDWRLLGARHLAVLSGSPYCAVAAAGSRRVILARASLDANLWAYSAELPGAPGALAYGATLWSICDDGYLRKFNTTTAALLLSVNVRASTNAWLGMNSSGVVVAPGAQGEICTVNSSGTIVDTLRVLPRIQAAVYSAGYLYCFGNSVGAVVTVSSAGVLQKIAEFTATNCRDIITAKLGADGDIAVACPDRVVVFSLADVTAPVYDSQTKSTTPVIGVGDDADHTIITATTTLGLSDAGPISDATYSSYAADWLTVSYTGRISVTALRSETNVWDAAKMGAHVTLSLSDLRASIAGDSDTVMALYSRNVSDGGKYAFELHCPASGHSSFMFGLGVIGQDYNESLAFGTGGWAYIASPTPARVHAGVVGASYGNELGVLECWVLCLLDFTAGTISFRQIIDNVSGPGTNLGVMYSGLSGTVYPAASVGYSGPETAVFDLNCAGPFWIDLPAGYIPFGGG